MSIKKKAILFFVVIFSSLIIITTLILDLVVETKFTEMEVDNEKDIITQISKTLRFNLVEMRPLLDDWTVWDDMYHYADYPTQSFEYANLGEDTLRNLDIEAMYILNAENDIVYQGSINSSAIYSESQDPETADLLRQIIPILKFENPKEYLLEIIANNESVYFVGAHTILTAKGEGPSHGTFIIFRKFDTEKPKSNVYLESINTPINFYNLSKDSIKKDFSTIIEDVEDQVILIKEISENELKSYTIIKDIFKQPLILIESTNTREIFKEGQNLMAINALIMTVISIFFAIYTFIVFRNEILNNFAKLSNFIKEHTQNPGSRSRLRIESNTEMLEISNSFNDLLDKLETQGERISKQGEELETKTEEVLASKNDLIKTNQELQELNKFMVGREMKMIELKKEVEALREKLKSVPLP